MNSESILVVDDNTVDRELLSIACQPLVDRISSASTAEEAIEIYKQERPDMILIDYRMEPISGLELSSELIRFDNSANCVMMSGKPDAQLFAHVSEYDLPPVIAKPIQVDNFHQQVKSALRRLNASALPNCEITLSNRMDCCLALLGESEEIVSLRRNVIAYVKDPTGVVIQGNRGFGKIELANFIHENSPYAAGPFVHYSCRGKDAATLSSQVISESGELGTLFARVSTGGTLSLSDIDGLTKKQQVYLAAKLAEINESMHVVFLSDMSVDELLMKGLIADELYFAIPTTQFNIPSLTNRPVDLEAIIRYVLQSNDFDLSKLNLASTQMDYLVADVRLNHSLESVDQLMKFLGDYPVDSLAI